MSTLYCTEQQRLRWPTMRGTVSQEEARLIGPGGLLLVIPQPIWGCPSFSFMGGVEKKKVNN